MREKFGCIKSIHLGGNRISRIHQNHIHSAHQSDAGNPEGPGETNEHGDVEAMQLLQMTGAV